VLWVEPEKGLVPGAVCSIVPGAVCVLNGLKCHVGFD